MKVPRRESEPTSTNASTSLTSPSAANLSSAIVNSSPSQSPVITSPEQHQLTQPTLQSLGIHSPEQYQLTQSILQSPEISFPEPHQGGIPETPQMPTRILSHQPLGSPVRPMRDPSDDNLDPILKLQIPSSMSGIREKSVSESLTTMDEIVNSNDRASEKLPSDPLDDFDMEDDTMEEDTKQKAKKARLTVENVEYQEDFDIRDSYFRVNTPRLRDRLKILGVYTDCIGILYVHRYFPFESLLIVQAGER
jgi:hypothetical protein